MKEENVSNSGSDLTEPCKVQNSRSKISAVEKNQIIKAYKDGINMRSLSKSLNVNFGTLKNIIYRYNKTGSISKGKIGGYRKKIINDQMGDQLLQEIDKKPNMTLQEMKLFFIEKGLTASTSTIATYLKNRFYTFNKIGYISGENNSVDVKKLRKDYVKKYLKDGIRSKHCIYIDETYCKAWTQRPKESIKEENEDIQVATQFTQNLSIIMAIGKNGPIHYAINPGFIYQMTYQAFLADVSLKLDENIYYFIHNNTSINNNVLTTINNHKILQLPPHSPFLNPVENYFSRFKLKLRKILKTSLELNETLQIEQIKEAIEKIIEDDKNCDLKSHYDKIKTYYPSCLMLKNIMYM